MELLISVIIGLVGIVLTIFYGVKSKKYEQYLESYHILDMQKRKLLKIIESLKQSNEAKDVEMFALRTKIEKIDVLSDSVFNKTLDPRKLKWVDKCPRCGANMSLDDVDYWYHCHNCGYEAEGI